MKPDQAKKSLAVIMPLVFVVACGGGGGATVSNAPEAGEANTDSNTTEQTVTGRVADGYLQGAIVCVDINENGQCDPDEPQVESSEGGSYSLDIPDSAAGKPVLAEVPVTAIDEDTGLPIGKELVLSAPGDRPEFVSPITTLVHQELKNNPNLTTDDAAAAVLETLGLPDEDDASLFTDYVAESEGDDEQRRDKFKFIHQTARVVASMMDEIHDNVETAARAEGIDVDSESTAAAIRDLVREEIRAQLPDISAAVADRILQIEEASQSGSGQEIELTREFDPDSISDSLGGRDLTTDIAEKIDAAKDEAPVERADMHELLAAGIYIIDLDCEQREEFEREDGLVKPAVDQPAVMLNDEGVPEVVHLPELCTAEYTHVITEAFVESTAAGQLDDATVAASANLIVTHYYYGFDDTTGSDGWIMAEQSREERPHILTLLNGDWTPVQNDGPYGVVEFTADGAAIMNTDEGKLLVYASSRDLSGKSVLHHVLNRGANDELAGLVDESKHFPDGSRVHQLHIKRNASPIVMWNWYPEADDTGIDYCAEFGGNCNVVYVNDEASYSSTPLVSLSDLYDGAVIDAVAHDNEEHLPVAVALHVKTTDVDATVASSIDGTANTTSTDKPGGIATWTVASSPAGIEPVPVIDPYPGGEPVPFDPEDCKAELGYVDGTQVQQTDESGAAIPYCPLPPRDSSLNVTQNDVTTEDAAIQRSENIVIGESRWHTVNVQGVDMIAIDVPISVRHRMDEDEVAELLLIQDGKFVRRGARIGAHSVDDETAYNGAAFDTLLPVIVDYIKPPIAEPNF